jgi:uracil-DNA glycosylase
MGEIMNSKQFKQQLLDQLYAPYKKCLSCPLGTLGRTQVVFGEGSPDARLMFIGEGPGQQEDLQGKPFVGMSGQLLNKILDLVGIKREDTFITNIVKCRPPNNRKPFPLESKTCKDILLSNQIKIIRPHVICTLGSAAIQGLLEKYDLKITQIRGKEFFFDNIIVIPTYHPAYILRNPKELQTLIKDIQKSADLLIKK